MERDSDVQGPGEESEAEDLVGVSIPDCLVAGLVLREYHLSYWRNVESIFGVDGVGGYYWRRD